MKETELPLGQFVGFRVMSINLGCSCPYFSRIQTIKHLTTMKETITIEKVHYEPHPIKDTVTAWEIEYGDWINEREITLFKSFLKEIKQLRKTFDNKQDWNYEVSGASVIISGHKIFEMPSYNEIDGFVSNMRSYRDYLIEEQQEIEYEIAMDNIGGDWEG